MAAKDWLNPLITLGVAAGVLIAVYYVVTSILTAGVSAYSQIYKQQWNALMQKMAQYVKDNGGSQTGWTPTQQASITQEETVLGQTQQALSAAANGLTAAFMWTIIGSVTAVVVGAVGAAALKSWIGQKYGNNAPSVYGLDYAVTRVIADELTQIGNVTQATNLISSASSMFTSIDSLAMTEQITSLQTSIASGTLVGAQLLAAQQMLNALTIDLAAIPLILATPILIP